MPALIELGVALGLVLALVVALGFLGLYRASLKPLLLGLAAALDLGVHLPFVGTAHLFRPVARLLEALAADIDHALSEAVLACEGGIVVLWHGLAKQAEWLGGLLGDLAETVESRFRWLLIHFPPAAILWQTAIAVAKLRHPIAVLQSAATAAEADIARLGHGIDRLRKAVEAQIARDLAQVRAAAGGLRRDVAGVLARLRSAERHLTRAGAVALVGTALAALGAGWIRCPRVGKVGKALCGMDNSLIESLLAGALVIVGTLSLAELASGFVAITDELAGLVLSGFRETKGVTAHKFSGYSGAGALSYSATGVLSTPKFSGYSGRLG